jgi:stage V sporulation protein S
MNRFFSKLDLRDIKIDPQGSHFPPDADDVDIEPGDELAPAIDPAPATDAARQPHVPAWATPSIDDNAPEPDEDKPVVPEEIITAATGAAEGAVPDETRTGEVLKVSARSRPSAVAGAIAGVVRESGRAEVQAIGAGATNQAVKAVAIARDYLRETGIEAICLPAFIDVIIDNEDRTAIRLVVEPR